MKKIKNASYIVKVNSLCIQRKIHLNEKLSISSSFSRIYENQLLNVNQSMLNEYIHRVCIRMNKTDR